jgi:flagellar basal body rod protein FlgG
VFLNAGMSAALDRIADRAADARRAFTPGAVAHHDDVARPAASDFTVDPLSVSAPADAYFVTRDEHGRLAYTRDGSFALRGGTLVDASGREVCAVRAPGDSPNALHADAVDEALGRVVEPRIEADGSLVYRRETIDPRNGARESQRVVVGRVVLARFPAGTRLASGDDNESFAPTGIDPLIGVPGDANFAKIAPMQRDRSRIDIDQSLVKLKDAYLAFDALRAAEAAKTHLGKTVMDLVK